MHKHRFALLFICCLTNDRPIVLIFYVILYYIISCFFMLSISFFFNFISFHIVREYFITIFYYQYIFNAILLYKLHYSFLNHIKLKSILSLYHNLKQLILSGVTYSIQINLLIVIVVSL